MPPPKTHKPGLADMTFSNITSTFSVAAATSVSSKCVTAAVNEFNHQE